MKKLIGFMSLLLLLSFAFSNAQEAKSISVTDMKFCTSVVDRVPMGVDTAFTLPVNKVFCYTEILNGMTQGEVYHVWFLDGVEKARVKLNVGADRWRTKSSKSIPPEWDGNWKVEVQTADGTIVRTEEFVYQKSDSFKP
jgi:hypothetical protein